MFTEFELSQLSDHMLPDEKSADQKSMFWRDEAFSPASSSHSESGSSILGSSNSSVISDDVTAHSQVSGSVISAFFLNHHHKKLNRSQSDSKAKYNRNSGGNASSKYKTELCNSFRESGDCKYKEKCQFAHGLHELRSIDRHPKYKTVFCRSYHTKEVCPYGQRCHFIHKDPNDLGTSPPMLAAASSANDLSLSLMDMSLSPNSLSSLSPASSINTFSFDSSSFSHSPPPSPIERRLPIFYEISGSNTMLPFSGLTA